MWFDLYDERLPGGWGFINSSTLVKGRNPADPRMLAESYIKHLLDHSHTLERSTTGRQGRKKGEMRKEEEASLDGCGSYPFTLIASAVSDGEEINMPLTICTPIHLLFQRTARVSATVSDGVCRRCPFFLFC